MIWGSANKQLYRDIKSSNAYSETLKTNTESAKPQPQKSATEEALEQQLAQMEHRGSELKQMLDYCEDKLSQVTSELSEIKSEQLPVASGTNSRPVSSQMFSDERQRELEYYMSVMNIDIVDAKQMALLSHVSRMGESAQRQRCRMARVVE